MVMARRPGVELLGPGPQLLGANHAAGLQHPLQGQQPAPVVAEGLLVGRFAFGLGHRGDELLAEVLPVEDAAGVEGHGQAEGPALPWLAENQLAVATRRRAGTVDVEDGGGLRGGHRRYAGPATLATPTMASRVTRGANSSSGRFSVPAGRSGST